MKKFFASLVILSSCSSSTFNKYDLLTIKKFIGYDTLSFQLSHSTVLPRRTPNELFNIGNAAFRKKNYLSAINTFKLMISLSGDRVWNIKDQLNSFLKLGYCYRILKKYKKSSICFLKAEEFWRKQYMKGGIVDNKDYSCAVLSRIYSDLRYNFIKLKKPIMASIFAWAALRQKEITDPSIKVYKRLNKSTIHGIDQNTFELFFQKLNLLTPTSTYRFYRKATETNRDFLMIKKNLRVSNHIYITPKFSEEIKTSTPGRISKKNLYQVFFRDNIISGYIYYPDEINYRTQKYSFHKGRVVSSLVELNSSVSKELRITYDKQGKIKTFILITEMVQQPFYKFIPEFVIYRLK